MTSQRPASTNKLWVVAAVLAASVCVCGGFVLASSGVLLVALAPWRSAASAPIVTPTTRPVSVGEWRALPDLPRTINVFLVDPNDPSRVFAGTGQYAESGSGLYRSEDGGVTWARAVDGLPDEPVMALALSADSSTLYANLAVDQNIYASADGGRSWRSVGLDPELCCNVRRQLNVAFDDPQRLYLLQREADPNLSISSDGGARWQRVADPREELQPRALALDPTDPARLYLGTSAHGVYVSTDRGETWAPANSGMVDDTIVSLAASPTEPGVVYAGSDDGHLFVTRDAGDTWRDLAAGLGLQSYEAYAISQLIIDPVSGALYSVVDLTGVLRSTDGGETWDRLSVPDARPDFPFPQAGVLGLISAPETRLLLALDYPDGKDSGAWLCKP